MRKKDPSQIKVINSILKYFNWKGSKMIWPYISTKGHKRAVINLADLLKIIKWEK